MMDAVGTTRSNLEKLIELIATKNEYYSINGIYDFAEYGNGEIMPIESSSAYSIDNEKVVRDWGELVANILGWSTTHPDMPVLSSHFDNSGFSLKLYGLTYYPALYGEAASGYTETEHWHGIFGRPSLGMGASLPLERLKNTVTGWNADMYWNSNEPVDLGVFPDPRNQ